MRARQHTLKNGLQRDSHALLSRPVFAPAFHPALSESKGLLAAPEYRSQLSERCRTTAEYGFEDDYERRPRTRASRTIATKLVPYHDD